VRWGVLALLAAPLCWGCEGDTVSLPPSSAGDAAAPVESGAPPDPPEMPAESADCARDGDVLCPVVEPDPARAPQPRRHTPTALVLDAGGQRAFVALTGSEAEPGTAVAVVDLNAGAVIAQIPVGPRPVALALHPDGDSLVVASSYDRRLAVIDTRTLQVTARPRVGHYLEDLAFSPDGAWLYATDRKRDGLWRLDARDLAVDGADFWPLGGNPSALSVCPDGRVAFVALTGASAIARVELATGAARALDLNAPPNDVLCLGRVVVAATLGEGSGHPQEGSEACLARRRADGAEHVHCDTTANTRFGDVQNDLAIFDVATGEALARLTSDTAEASRVDTPGGVRPERMRVAGAFPRALAAEGRRLLVSYAASAQVQAFALPTDAARWDGRGLDDGAVHAAGWGAHGLAIAGDQIVVANRLAEDLSLIDLRGGPTRRVPVGNVSPPFPATDAEIGEWYFFGAYLSADGDASCSHCHPDATTDGKAWSVATVPLGHSRQVPSTRNLGATQPLLLEGTQDEGGFNLEMEDLSPRVDFDPEPARTFAAGREARELFFRRETARLIGREIGFDEMAGLVGRFLVHEPRLLPNPFPDDTAQARRGRALYLSSDVACDTCHPVEGGFTTGERFDALLAHRPGDRPNPEIPAEIARDFLGAEVGAFDTPSLRGAWDRPARFLHDGRARSVAETILTPGHAALGPGERGLNFGGGFGAGEAVFDTHGGVSHLSVDDVADLLVYVNTIE
jgi:hypothetical protein